MDAEAGTLLRLFQKDIAAMELGQSAHDGKPQTISGFSAGGDKRVEDDFTNPFGNARSVVGHADTDSLLFVGAAHADAGGVARGMGEGIHRILEQIAKDAG